jgi:hypothetical protein
MRDWFAGTLFAVALGLYVYKGLNDREDRLLNVAAVLAIATAVNGRKWAPPGGLSPNPSHRTQPSRFRFSW